jgi:hypothetical protein
VVPSTVIFPGSLSISIGTVAPTERGNVIATTSAEHGITAGIPKPGSGSRTRRRRYATTHSEGGVVKLRLVLDSEVCASIGMGSLLLSQ